jgi:hypothetical protein
MKDEMSEHPENGNTDKYLLQVSLFIVTLLLIVASVSAQDKPLAGTCPVTLANAPSLRVFRLGQTVDEVISKYPEAQINEEGEESRQYIYFASLSEKQSSALDSRLKLKPTYLETAKHPEFEGLKSMTLEFINGKVAIIIGSYEHKKDFERVEQFADITAQSMNLNGTWRKLPRDYDRSTAQSRIFTDTMVLPCGAIQVEASFIQAVIGGNDVPLSMRIILADKNALKDEKVEAEKERQKKRETFKP